MAGKMTPTAFAAGFGLAAAAIGALLVILYVGGWAMAALGGPDLAVPGKLMQSGLGLMFIGFMLRVLVGTRATTEKPE